MKETSLAEQLLFGPLAGARYRIDGPRTSPLGQGALPPGGGRARPGAPPGASDQRLAALQEIAVALGDAGLAETAARLARTRTAAAA